jgi:CBS domain-containing protein
MVRDVMTPAGEFATTSPQEDASEAFDKLMQQEISQLPVLKNGEYEGMLRRRDILRWLQLQSQT